MSMRFRWLAGCVLITVAFLLSCGSSSNKGFIYLVSQGSQSVNAISLDLHSGELNSSNSALVTTGDAAATGVQPTALILNPTQTLGFVANTGSNDITVLNIAKDGKVSAVGNTPLNAPAARPVALAMWMSLYTPQAGEQSAEMLNPAERRQVAQDLLAARQRNPKLLMNAGIVDAICNPPAAPSDCMFSRMSTNFTADLRTRVEPCIFGGNPDCSQCGCAISSGLHWLKTLHWGPLSVERVALSAAFIGSRVGRLKQGYASHPRWSPKPEQLVQIR